MRLIKNGRAYDTATATEVAGWSNGRSYTDFSYCAETLYRKRNGEFFLHGRGGAMSRWSEPCGSNARCEGEDILPLTVEEAREWVEAHANADYEGIFGRCEE